jgi:hypothetical protein
MRPVLLLRARREDRRRHPDPSRREEQLWTEPRYYDTEETARWSVARTLSETVATCELVKTMPDATCH